MNDKPRGRNDPERRQRIIDATLDVVSEYGVAATTHRRIAAQAAVPLGSVTYYFASLEMLLTTAFLQLATQSSNVFKARMNAATNYAEACEAVTDIIAQSLWAQPRTLLLSYELYAFAARKPPLKKVMREWMGSSRAALDALIEGIGIHNSIDDAPLDHVTIRAIIDRLTSGPVVRHVR